MCTVTYLPKSNGDFFLTSNRDEQVSRARALAPQEYIIQGKKIMFPKDPVAGGSWIACSGERVACLLNGAFEKHMPSPPYRKSRGLVLLDYFSFENAQDFISRYSFENIEPFTLVLVEPSLLTEFRWDGKKTYARQLDPLLPWIWSSATLYPKEISKKRQYWFDSWLLENKNYTPDSILHFHRTAGDGNPENDIRMNRTPTLTTVSITSIEKTATTFKIRYEDIVYNSFTAKVLE